VGPVRIWAVLLPMLVSALMLFVYALLAPPTPAPLLSLLLIGLMKFGMGLLNIQGQVQGIAIGLLLILSILLPNLARQISWRNVRWKSRSLIYALGTILVFALFFAFFFWSRAPVLAGG